MTRRRPWEKLSPAARVEAVRPLAADQSNSIIAFRLGAPVSAIARIASEIRREQEQRENVPSQHEASAKQQCDTLGVTGGERAASNSEKDDGAIAAVKGRARLASAAGAEPPSSDFRRMPPPPRAGACNA